MKKLRVLIAILSVLILLRQTPAVRAASQIIGCINSIDQTPATTFCDGCCNNQSFTQNLLNYIDTSVGLTAYFRADPGSCGGIRATQYCQAVAPYCGSSGEYYFTSTPNAAPCCPSEGQSCASGQCCPPQTCFNGVCQTCVSYQGVACQPADDLTGNYCSKWACDGTCPPQCITSNDCAGKACVEGCCQSGGNCDSDEGETCATDGCGNSCGVRQCDGSCDASDCSYCVCYMGSSCGVCGSYNCTGGCDDPCAGSGGGGDGGCLGCQSTWDCPIGQDCIYADGCSACQDYYEDPIIVDLSGNGFPMTSAQAGVDFNFFGNRKPIRVSWTQAGVQEGWLALDRNNDHQITSGLELFSNVTPQPGPQTQWIGFKALAVFDSPAYGGNNDRIISSKDAVYSKLTVWVDSNHNGISDPGELIPIQRAGIEAISVDYQDGHYTDSNGNQFRYRSKVQWLPPKKAGSPWAYDVILVRLTQ